MVSYHIDEFVIEEIHVLLLGAHTAACCLRPTVTSLLIDLLIPITLSRLGIDILELLA